MIKIEIPIKIQSINIKSHWAKSYIKNKKAQAAILYFITPHNRPPLPCLVTLTRIAPREFDYDNLVSSFKNTRDTIADWLIPGLAPGRADGDKRITWEYKQEKRNPKEHALRIEIKKM